MRPMPALLLALAILALLVLGGSFYVLDETEQAVITQFGDPVGDPILEAGLHLKLPFVHDVKRFEKRLLEWDGARNQIVTADKRLIWIDTTARWRVADALLFLQSVRTEQGAQGRLDDILDAAARTVISAHKLIEVVRLTDRVADLPRDEEEMGFVSSEARERIEVGRRGIVQRILETARPKVAELGIELRDIRLKRINYVEEVRGSIYKRMISERQRIAERWRSEGEGLKAEILGRRDWEEKKITSEAYREAQEIVAKADAEAARIYADTYGQDPEFYAFLRSLEAYRLAVGGNHTLVIAPDSELYRYLFEPN